MKSKHNNAGFLAGLLLILFLASCKKDANNNGNNGGIDTKTNKVSITGFKFSPATLTIANGVMVTWTNMDGAAHTVTADDNSFTSGTLQNGDTYTHKFTAAGTYKYHCSFHAGMTASVEVQ